MWAKLPYRRLGCIPLSLIPGENEMAIADSGVSTADRSAFLTSKRGWVQSGCRLCKPYLHPSFFAEYIQLDVVSQKASRYNSLRYVFIPLPQPNTCAKKDQIDSCCNHTTSDNHTDNTKTQQRVQNYNYAQNAK